MFQKVCGGDCSADRSIAGRIGADNDDGMPIVERQKRDRAAGVSAVFRRIQELMA